jgi:malonyl-CoA decarboxylase
LFDRTLDNLRRVWRDLAGGATLADRVVDGDLDQDGVDAVRLRMVECLAARGGEASARGRAAELGAIYLRLGKDGRRKFLELLAGDFAIDRDAVRAAAEAYLAVTDDGQRDDLERKLRDGLTASRVRLLTQFTSLPQGVKFLVDLRADLLEAIDGDAEMAALDADLKALLAGWFDVGFLELAQVTWDSPASLLEKLIRYEAVHQITSWSDLQNRLDRDRRLFAFFHPRMPTEPLIFVEVALVAGIAESIQSLLDEQAPVVDPRAADTAIFYSISNAQVGLRGIAFGNFLIKQVVDRLSRDFPRLRTFATLSPVPGFAKWLARQDLDALAALTPGRRGEAMRELVAERGLDGDFRGLLAAGWQADAAVAAALREPLKALCAHYLARARDRGNRPVDPVARFHLGNGAGIERVNWLGDQSPKGLRESHGLMVNYGYRLDAIEDNHEAFATHGAIAMSDQVRALLPRTRDETLPERLRHSLFGATRSA